MNAFSLSAMQVGVFDSAAYVNNAKVKMLTFPNYSDPAFPKKWKNMGDSVAFSVEELPSEGKENNIRVLTCTVHTKGRPTWRYDFSKMKLPWLIFTSILYIIFLFFISSSKLFL